jgi:hypothetical protein
VEWTVKLEAKFGDELHPPHQPSHGPTFRCETPTLLDNGRSPRTCMLPDARRVVTLHIWVMSADANYRIAGYPAVPNVGSTLGSHLQLRRSITAGYIRGSRSSTVEL